MGAEIEEDQHSYELEGVGGEGGCGEPEVDARGGENK